MTLRQPQPFCESSARPSMSDATSSIRADEDGLFSVLLPDSLEVVDHLLMNRCSITMKGVGKWRRSALLQSCVSGSGEILFLTASPILSDLHATALSCLYERNCARESGGWSRPHRGRFRWGRDWAGPHEHRAARLRLALSSFGSRAGSS